ncbi:MAG: hypothetical protein MUF84_12765 [Anaerolineae bacterium]|nr:hypothetical protein [Anaerolineae bacterium]
MLVPPFEGLDELEHFEVVRHVASTGRLPVHDVADAAGYRVRQEASQPPLYYYLAAGWTRLLALPLVQPVAHEVPAQLVACGSEYVPYNKAVWRHRDSSQRSLGWSRCVGSLR